MNPIYIPVLVGGVGAYIAFLGTIIYFAIKWNRRMLESKSAAIRGGLESAGAKMIGDAKPSVSYYAAPEHEYELGGRRIWANAYYVSRSWIRANVRTLGGPYPAVMIYPEGKVERFGKLIGLNREVQTGDKTFDDAAYVDTIESNEEYVKRLLGSTEVRDAVRELLQLGYRVQFNAGGVEAFQMRYAASKVDGSQAGKAAQAIGRIVDHAPTFKTEPLVKPGSVRSVALGIVLMIGWIAGAAFAGGAAVVTSRTLDGFSQFLAFVVGGGLAWVLYLVLVGFLVRGLPSAFRTLLVAGFLGLIGVPAGAGSLLLCLNQWLDGAQPTDHGTVVRKRTSYKSDRWLRVDTWRDHDEWEKVKVTHEKYDAVKVGDTVIVRVHDGAFGWPWADPVR